MQGSCELSLRSVPLVFLQCGQLTEDSVRGSRAWIDAESCLRGVPCLLPPFATRYKLELDLHDVRPGKRFRRSRPARVKSRRLLKVTLRLCQTHAITTVECRPPTKIQCVRLSAMQARCGRQIGRCGGNLQLARHRAGDLALHRQNVIERSVVSLRPTVCARVSVDQLCRHPNVVTGAPHAAFDYISHR